MTEGVIVSQESDAKQTSLKPIYNDFSMVVATVNGSGSQTSNLAIIRALFRMGLSVSGKNLFPSNIQGLPTWFTIRVSADGYTARRESVEILVAMNLATFAEDHNRLAPGGACYYADDFPLLNVRDDITYYPMPIKQLVKDVAPPKDLREYIANMGSVGIVAQMLDIELDEIRGALMTHFRGKEGPVNLNMKMIEEAGRWAQENLAKEDPYFVKRDDQTENRILIEGNTASALGAIYGGVTFAAWYPITPASSIADGLKEYMPKLRRDEESGKSNYAIIQAEDEIAAIGMAVGAGWAGARAMTSTSGPGISLMAEFAGLAFHAEIPIVVWDVQRMGPSTGLPTRTAQGDLRFVRFLGHGDSKHVVLLPGNIQECFEFGWRGFDIAERLQTPVFILSDLDLGMNLWMSEPFEYPDQEMDRGKVLSEEDLEKLGEFARFRDVDGDGITYRTLPGNEHPLSPWLARGTGHDENAVYSERPNDWLKNMERINRKHETAKQYVPKPVMQRQDDARIGLIAFGSSDPAVVEARDRLAGDGIATDYLRIRALPFTKEVSEFIRQHEQIYVIEMNFDGQMRQLLQLEVPEEAAKIRSLSLSNGLPLSAGWVVESIIEALGGSNGN